MQKFQAILASKIYTFVKRLGWGGVQRFLISPSCNQTCEAALSFPKLHLDTFKEN